ncbi:MAG: hypothetical protein OMM_05769 [Candidatus Magnetoglobus multicellularis str. Araruama]|uniref:Putative restriction endonuclease domain-containing protein n=1 Tax=Candidatus Magnetoglobus multicellularis str. Araruama TaxID=890399 RepID=A0A1V1NUB3_9BACT|nr:MAG: hypothetical protein OMM_05769 [Candidatus Magnetoglobus multicellularis str. Araruama]
MNNQAYALLTKNYPTNQGLCEEYQSSVQFFDTSSQPSAQFFDISSQPSVHLFDRSSQSFDKKNWQSLKRHQKPSEPQSKDGLIVDEATFWADYYEDMDFRYEWNNGILEEKPMAVISGILYTDWLISLLKEYLKAKNYEYLIVADIGFKLKLPGKSVIRRPDHAILLGEKATNCDTNASTYQGVYDICIETLSHSKQKYIDRDTIDKKREYSQGKVKEYYIIDYKKDQTLFYSLNTNGGYSLVKPKNGIIRSTVLPGFQFRERDIYARPDPVNLINDPIYQSFVAIDLQKERKAREQERKAKDAALKIAEQERKAKDAALKIAEQERKGKEVALQQAQDALQQAQDALQQAENERIAKEKLQQLLIDRGIKL